MPAASRDLRRRRICRAHAPRSSGAARRGFSLLEMLIVLAILAALTLLAVQSLGPVEQQARALTTQKTLENLKSAILSISQAGGQTVVGGFAADMGHLPDSSSAVAFANDLVFNNPANGTERSMFGVVGPLGWRGAYLQNTTTSTAAPVLLDAWLQPLSLTFCDHSGAVIPGLTNPSDRMVIYSSGSPVDANTHGRLSTTITYGSLTAWPLTVRICATNTDGTKFTPTGTISLTLAGGLSATTPGVIAQTIVPATSITGTGGTFAFYPTPAQLLVGARELSVTFTDNGAMTGYTVTPTQTFHLNLLPGTSPSQEVIVARQN